MNVEGQVRSVVQHTQLRVTGFHVLCNELGLVVNNGVVVVPGGESRKAVVRDGVAVDVEERVRVIVRDREALIVPASLNDNMDTCQYFEPGNGPVEVKGRTEMSILACAKTAGRSKTSPIGLRLG